MEPLVIAIGGSVLLVFLLIVFVISRIKVAGPNEAFIVTGRKGRTTSAADGTRIRDLSGQKVVMGASVFVLPVVQKLHTLDLSSRGIRVEINGAVSKQGIRTNLQGVAIVKVGGSETAIRAAAQRFLHQQAEIDQFTREVLAGALRSIVGRLTVEEIIRDRAAFASAVAEEAEHSMTNQGLVLDTFQLQDIFAEGSYLDDLGRPEAARVLKDAAIAEAQARQAAERERLIAEESIAESERNLEIKRTAIQAEIDAAKAQSDAAGPLAKAERDQAILTEQHKVAQRQAELKDRELDTEIRKPADAARYRVEQEAEGARNADVFRADAARQSTIAAAQAEAERARLTGEGEKAHRSALAEAAAVEGAKEGEAEQQRRSAIAEAVELEGKAEAEAILAKGRAEAEAMRLKAEAFENYGEAAVLDLLVRVLPDVVGAASEPMKAIDKMTVISTDGATSLTKSVATNVSQGLQLGSDLTGVDLAGLLSRLGERAAGGNNHDQPESKQQAISE
ncbi:flotillin family protein [Natronosporangium hydrolyticum]|uniref:Flotillin family protein n=1 Tax=Natronosporangium hydrolyticum TaxID=2811111 RepID=A0A895YFB6_9ACTN|nr:SPFH domain-containing protein [Natronosporangium hydrolyticum]QSB14805.1 flotillin family protein [Natronosporangium hydrolyticum]